MKVQPMVCLTLAVVSFSVAFAEPPRKTLAECIEIALAEHPDVRAARAAAQVGQEQTWQAVSSALPQVNLTYAAQRRHTSPSATTGTRIGGAAQTFDFYSTGVGFSQVLFDFGQSLHAIRAARASERSLQADVTTSRETVILDVKNAYFGLLQANRLLAVADENLRDAQKHVELAEGRLEVGVASRFDVTQAQVQLVSAELAQVTARNDAALARETFRNALGIDGPLDFEIVDVLDVHSVDVEEGRAVDLAYQNRPELQSLKLRELAVRDQIAALRTTYLPIIAGNGNYNYSGTSYPLENTWTLGATANWSILNGGLTTAQIGAAKANLLELQSQERSLRHQIALQVRQAVLNLGRARESIRVSERGLQAARENLAIAEGQYGAGVGSIVALTDAQASLIAAEGSNVQALAGYQTAVAAIERATAQSFTGAPAR